MTFVQRAENTADDSNQKALEELTRAIEWNTGEFSFILAHCNSVALQHCLVPKLRKYCSVDICEIVLDKSVQTLFGAIQSKLGAKQPEALVIYGLESVSALDKVLAGANNIREEFRKNLDFPLVVWVTEEVLKKIIKLAPDFYSWATTVEFQIPTHELVNFIEQTADAVFSKVLEAGAGVFLDSYDFELGIGSPHRVELESAQHELQNRGVRLSAELEASLEFVLSRDIDTSIEQSRHHLERSLELWETNPNVERFGCVLYSLGLWWYTFAERNQTECNYDCAYAQAKDYFQRCVDVFEQANRPDLSAKFINVLGVTLQKQKKWDELAAIAQKALSLHQIYSDSFRLARAYGLLAELQLAKLDWKKAKEYAQEALSLLLSASCAVSTTPISSALRKNLDWALSYHQGCYLLALAKAQQGLNLIQEAIKTLEKAKIETKIHYDPPLYLQILEELRKCYFQQRQYLTAFEIKQQQRSIEQQYGFRAFIGAGRLQAKQQVDNPVMPQCDRQGTVAQEIVASGRHRDIDRLIERLGRPDHKLTIIVGPSGVGKSSLLQAGLIPILKQKSIGTRDVLPVLQQVYPDYSMRELGKSLTEALIEKKKIQPDTANIDSIESLLEQLRQNINNNLLTVIIFDQFEEHLFLYKYPEHRQWTYELMAKLLEIPYVKIICSMREDYLHHLLVCNNQNLINLEIINNNILDKKILYTLGNFVRDEAKSIIQKLSESTQFYLEESLIDKLVQDLAEEVGEIRPIELQVVGSQLQTDKITTLKQYQQLGDNPKGKLIERFLEEIIKDCGPENECIAQLVLYLLTDENNTRPRKSRAELLEHLENKAEKLDFVLEILVKAGLVFLVPDIPTDRFQLVHDYLVSFIRQQRGAQLLKELQEEKKQRQLSEAKLNRVLKRRLQEAYIRGAVIASLTVFAVGIAVWVNKQNKQAEISEVKKEEWTGGGAVPAPLRPAPLTEFSHF